jgi:type I restriction enzyme M protein
MDGSRAIKWCDYKKTTKARKRISRGWGVLKGRLVPISLLISTYYAAEQKRLDELNARLEQIGVQMDELKEEHGGDEGLLAEVIENDKISKGNVQKRIKDIRDDAKFADELVVLQKYAALFEGEVETKRAIKESEKELEKKVLAKYPALSLKEIKTLVVEHKWMNALEAAVQGEVDRISHQLAGRMQELAERYESTLPEIMNKVETLTAKVDTHLKGMGFNF